MYSIDNAVLQAYASESREIALRATFNDTTVVTGEHIKSITVTDSVGYTDTLSLGNACSKKLELDMFVPDGLTSIDKAKIKIEVGIDIEGTVEYTPLGIFFVDDYVTKNDYKSVKITAFDAMFKIAENLGDTYFCSLLASNVTALEVINDICSQAGVTVDIGDPSTGSNSYQTYLQSTAGVTYSDSGVKSNSNTSIGINTPFRISANATDIDYSLQSDNMDFPSEIKVLYFSDVAATNLLSVHNYEIDTEFVIDSGLGWEVEYQASLPTHSSDIYVVICANITSYSATDLKIYLGLNQRETPVTHYVNSTVTIPNPEYVETPARDILGYMAGILGCNAVINRLGNLTLKRFETTLNDIDYDEQFMDGLDKTHQTTLTIGYLTTGAASDDDGTGGTVTVGSGSYGLNFENPYIMVVVNSTPSTVAQNIYNMYSGLTILPCNVDYRGNPSIDCGDIISVEDKDGTSYNVIVLNHSISVSGGLRCKIESDLKTDVKKDFVSVPNSKRIGSKVDTFIKAYGDIVRELVGVQGGYVQQVRDSNNVVRALAITQSNIKVHWDSTNGKVVVDDVSNSGEPLWVWSYGGLSFSPNGGTTYNVAINMQGQIYANYLQSPLGYIGGWILNSEKIFQRVKVGTTTYEFTLKSDSSSSQTKKAIYANTFTDNRNSDSVDADSYKTENFFIRRNGEIFLASGSIAGWNINNNSFYSDYTDSSSNTYRTYIQNAAAAGANSWVFSVQKKLPNNLYEGLFIVKANGEVRASAYKDIDGYNLISWNNTNHYYVFGYGSYSLGWDTYLEGGNILLRAGSSGEVKVQKGTTTCLTLGRGRYTIDGSTANRDFINSSGGFVISANNGSNRLHLWGSSIYITSDTEINGDLECGAISATGTVKINYTASAACPVYMTKAGALYPYTSSRRYKENIKYELDEDLNPEKLYDLPIAQYNYKDEYTDRSLAEGKQIGIIAEDINEIYPNAVIKNGEGEVESWQSMILLPAMLKLIQEQKQEIDTLKQNQTDMENRISTLEEIIKNLTKE